MENLNTKLEEYCALLFVLLDYLITIGLAFLPINEFFLSSVPNFFLFLEFDFENEFLDLENGGVEHHN
jgi:hypothetical protein